MCLGTSQSSHSPRPLDLSGSYFFFVNFSLYLTTKTLFFMCVFTNKTKIIYLYVSISICHLEVALNRPSCLAGLRAFVCTLCVLHMCCNQTSFSSPPPPVFSLRSLSIWSATIKLLSHLLPLRSIANIAPVKYQLIWVWACVWYLVKCFLGPNPK